MRRYQFLIILLPLIGCRPGDKYEKPPLAEIRMVSDTYFGTRLDDPYRYMENLEDTTVQNWLKVQADHSRKILDNIPGRQDLLDKMRNINDRTASSVTLSSVGAHDQYIYLKTTPLDNSSKLYYRKGYEGEESLIFDPTTFGNDTSISYVISYFYISQNGSKVAISLMAEGLEIPRLVILELESGNLYPEIIERTFNFTWLPGDESFLYQKLNSDNPSDPETFLNTRLFLHELGTDPENDKEIFSRQKYPELGLSAEDFSYPRNYKGCEYLFIIVATSDRRLNSYYAPVRDIKKDHINWQRLFNPDDNVYSFRVTENELYFLTPENSPNFKILRTSLRNPDISNAELVVPEYPDATISYFTLTRDGLYFTRSKNGVQENLNFRAFNDPEIQELDLPLAAGSIYIQTRGFLHEHLWATISGWTSDYQRYRYYREENKFTLENLSEVVEYPEFANLVVEELMVESHDNELVPLSLVYQEGMKKNGKNPVFIYGYGAYGYSLNPSFDPESLLWAHEGGIYAIAHVRGGGELGDTWYRGGLKTTKPNTWKDLIACAEYLVENQYTSKKKIAIYGMSAGGIMIGRAMTERPDLFAAAIPSVGVMNAVRGEETPSGPQNVPEFGTIQDSVECMALIEMDAYQHLREGVEYPATLVTAGMNDTRVIAWQPAKFAARLQAVNVSSKPILLKVNYEAGHGIGDTRMIYYQDMADRLSFAFWQTGHPDFQF
jgi:prolyl oligopeptidase